MVLADLADFGRPDLQYRLLRGGLPPFWMSTVAPEREYQEWLDAQAPPHGAPDHIFAGCIPKTENVEAALQQPVDVLPPLLIGVRDR
jgi:hypothetical protein